MATAKQIAARKRFAELARSGKLATMRKKAAKKPAASASATRAKKNPAPKKAVQTKRGGCNPKYSVQIKKGSRWTTVAEHTSQIAAESAAKTLHAAGLKAPIRVWG
jgi:hypothetical protein